MSVWSFDGILLSKVFHIQMWLLYVLHNSGKFPVILLHPVELPICTEQVGRLGCFGFMIINIPGTWFGWWSDEAFALYLIVDTILVMLYCAIWIICFKKNSVFRALALSIIPSMLFLFSGIMSRSVLLIIASVLFAPSHIVISYKNVKWYLQIPVCHTCKNDYNDIDSWQ